MDNTHQNHTNNPFIQFIIWINGIILYLVSSQNIEFVYNWTFKIISLISVVMICVINRKKFIQEFKKIFKK